MINLPRSIKKLRALAVNPENITLLERLAGHSHAAVRWAVACNPACPSYILERLFRDADETVKYAASVAICANQGAHLLAPRIPPTGVCANLIFFVDKITLNTLVCPVDKFSENHIRAKVQQTRKRFKLAVLSLPSNLATRQPKIASKAEALNWRHVAQIGCVRPGADRTDGRGGGAKHLSAAASGAAMAGAETRGSGAGGEAESSAA